MTYEDLDPKDAEALDGILLRALKEAICTMRTVGVLEQRLLSRAREIDLGKLRFLHIDEFWHDVLHLMGDPAHQAEPMRSFKAFTL